MKKYGVLGAGMMSREVARDLIQSEPEAEVVLVDISEENLRSSEAYVSSDKSSGIQADISDVQKIAEIMRGCDLFIGALPHGLSLTGIKAALEAGIPFVDLVGSFPAKRAALDSAAKENNCLIIPGCGVAPGISNMCVGHGMTLLDETHDAIIYVGGVPVEKTPPLHYQTVYLLESVFNAYSRPATIKLDGKSVTVDPLSGLEEISFDEPFGSLEAYYSDGLASLPVTVWDEVKYNLYEKTLRYPGHTAKIEFLKQCGLLKTDPVFVNGTEVVPRELLFELFREPLRLGDKGDILAMRIIVAGLKDGKKKKLIYELVDYYDTERNATAMARTTSYPATIAARMITDKVITETGVLFPEQLFTGNLFDAMVDELGKRGVTVRQDSED